MKSKLFFIVLFLSILGAYIIWVIGYLYPTHIYSPGDLANKHQYIRRCKSCHIPFKGIPSSSCQTSDCHPAEKLLATSAPTINELHKWAHGKDCMKCHTDHKGTDGNITIPFNHSVAAISIADECLSCHEADFRRAHGERYETGCNQCHTSLEVWKEVSFDHEVTAVGKMCLECHPTPKDGIHNYYRQACEKCHNIEEWKPATFDHTMVTGAGCLTCHEEARDKAHPGKFSDTCESCHGTIDWQVLYFDHEELVAGERCVSCHSMPDDSLHLDVSDECETCHSTNRWKPAFFEHIDYFPLTDEHLVSCDKCHETKDYKEYTCIKCHVHDTKKIRHEHEEHDISDYPRCLDCHSVKLYDRRYGTPKVHEGFEDEDEGERYYRRHREHEYDDDD